MWDLVKVYSILAALLYIHKGAASPVSQIPLRGDLLAATDRNISAELFGELEELSRIVDISYCVGTTGIQKPFLCASRCQDFESFELVTVGRAIAPALFLLTVYRRHGKPDLYCPTAVAISLSIILLHIPVSY